MSIDDSGSATERDPQPKRFLSPPEVSYRGDEMLGQSFGVDNETLPAQEYEPLPPVAQDALACASSHIRGDTMVVDADLGIIETPCSMQRAATPARPAASVVEPDDDVISLGSDEAVTFIEAIG
jgi:hypothetical protein